MKLNIFTVETLQDFLEYEMIDKQIWQNQRELAAIINFKTYYKWTIYFNLND